ncbi:guanylate kinase-like isoform X1 [Hibiscus syriacus]|uniref:Guanylate kinase-like isoform X1 n=1 Tax=Hibiscus syriacus TaxID=106335 RepID=A0A6A2Y5Q5_HIBSY|nr:guanylate kinase-like isoform X1 [Hibiscus syriacus]
MQQLLQWDSPNLNAAAASSLLTWALTLLASHGTLDVLTIIVSGRQLFCTGAIHAGAEDAALNRMPSTSAGTV